MKSINISIIFQKEFREQRWNLKLIKLPSTIIRIIFSILFWISSFGRSFSISNMLKDHFLLRSLNVTSSKIVTRAHLISIPL
ncbi:hypothetical protein NC652_003148 [Populus alba x Populus x berolinensis]|nr:hypothetical protein NC652_003148 [Populus alba x Populus x berolinensis]